jgi:hypothetical protein
MSYCEDYPCCGHTPADPCERQWYDEPDAFTGAHAFCEHEIGQCDVEPDYANEGREDIHLDGMWEE